MRIGQWVLILSVTFWAVAADRWLPLALANTATSTQTNTNTSTQTSTQTNTSTSTSTNTQTGGTKDNQKTAQDDTEETNDEGAQQSQMMGMMAMAAGAAMVAAGMAMQPPNMGLVMAGIALIIAGMLAMQAAQQMADNANTAGQRSANMSGISGLDPLAYKKNELPDPTTKDPGPTSLKVDPAFASSGKAQAIFDDFEQKTGLSREGFINDVNGGKPMSEILAGLPNSKFNKDQFEKMLADGAANGSAASSDEVMNQLGLTPEDLAALAKNSGASATGTDYSYSAAGGGRSPASGSSAGGFGLDGLLGAGKSENVASATLNGNAGALSPEIQSALDRNGITSRTLFEMVRSQYKKKTPMMFGVQPRKINSGNDNPFENMDLKL